MPCVTLHTTPTTTPLASSSSRNSLPTLLQTPSGLALLEIQGTIHAPFPPEISDSLATTTQTNIGRLEFPLYDPSTASSGEGKWMKKVYLYVGKHQRLVGEVRKLQKVIAMVRKREESASNDMEWDLSERSKEGREQEELEIAQIVRWKIIFGGRPEPVGADL